jgi:hypothetical protein
VFRNIFAILEETVSTTCSFSIFLMMLQYLAIVLLAVGCHSAEQSYGPTEKLGSGLSSLTGLGGSYGAFTQNLLASQANADQVYSLPAGTALPAHYGTPQVVQNGQHQELVVQHPNPRRILVRVVKPIIFEERIVIVPYRRVTHEVRPVIEERHTVIYGKDGKAIGGPVGQKAGIVAAGVDSYKAGSYPIGAAAGPPLATRAVAEPVYTEPIVRKVGQSLSKRASYDSRIVDNTREQKDQYFNRLNRRA